MRDVWPSLHSERFDSRTACWRGPLKPFLQTYEVKVFYRVPLIVERIDPLSQQPRVEILSPPLKQREKDVEGFLPHVYWDVLGRPSLCLFDYEAAEWTPFCLLANTIIPWAIDWLACYEGWRATGTWTGGGRHAPPLITSRSPL